MFNVFRIAASGGSNANSGTTSSVIYTSSIAVWDGTSQITGISGVSGVVNVNDWVNVASTYIAQVTATSSTGFTLSTTAKYGTAPGAGTVTVTDGGYFASLAAIGIFGSTAVYNSTEFQIQQGNSSLTLSTAVSLNLQGTTSFPVWYRGFNTTPGDLDNGSTTLAYPTIVAGTNTFQFGGPFTVVSGLAVTASRNGGALVNAGSNSKYYHCQFATTATNTGASAVSNTAVQATYVQCSFSGTSGNNQIIAASNAIALIGCYLSGAGAGTTQDGIATTFGGNLTVIKCTFNKIGAKGIHNVSSSITLLALGNTFNSCGSDAINFAATPGGGTVIADNEFVNTGTNGSGYDINNASGSNLTVLVAANNSKYNPASGHLNGWGDTFELNSLTESSNPFVSSTNLALLASAAGANAGIPGQWENQTAGLGGFPDCGAWQREPGSFVGDDEGLTLNTFNTIAWRHLIPGGVVSRRMSTGQLSFSREIDI